MDSLWYDNDANKMMAWNDKKLQRASLKTELGQFQFQISISFFCRHGYSNMTIRTMWYPLSRAIQCDTFYSMVNKILHHIHKLLFDQTDLFFPFMSRSANCLSNQLKVHPVSKGWWTVMTGSSLAEKLQVERKSLFRAHTAFCSSWGEFRRCLNVHVSNYYFENEYFNHKIALPQWLFERKACLE